jgi:hypothetical protein
MMVTGTTTTIMTTTFTATMIMSMTSGRGKTEPAAAAEAAKAAEVAAVATVRADNNQQRAVKTAAAAIAVGKRCQARGEKRWRGQRQGGGPEVRVEIGAQRTLLGNNFAHIKAMRLANVYLERSQCLASRQILSVLQIDLSARADRKMVIFYVYLLYFLKKSRFHRTDTQVKTIPSVCEGKTFTHSPMRICVSVYFLK